mgnify:FL=1
MFQGMEYIYEVYKEKSFSKAAANLFISQPSLSANVKRVEQRIGFPVFDRSTKPLEVTEYGKEYLRCVEEILSIQKGFSDYLHDLGNLDAGSLTLGGSNLFSSWILPPLISDFVTRYPNIKINLVEETTARLTEFLQKGAVDLILDNTDLGSESFASRIFQEEHLLLAVPRHFPANDSLKEFQISEKQIQNQTFLEDQILPVPLNHFQELPFIMLKDENDTGKRARQICKSSHFTPNIILNMDQQMTAYNVCQSGLGISFIGDIMLSHIPHNKDVVYYKLPLKHNCRKVCFYWKKGKYFTRAMEEFLNMSCL